MKLKEMKFNDLAIGVEFRVNGLSQVKYIKVPGCQTGTDTGLVPRNAVCLNYRDKGELYFLESDRMVHVES